MITTACHGSNCECNNMQTWFPCFFGVDLNACSTLHGQFSFYKTSRPTTKATGSEASRWQVVYCEVRNWYIIQENQVGYDNGGGTINYILSLQPCSFDQVIFIGFSLRHSKNIFHFLESVCYMPLTTHLTLHWKMHFPAI